MQYTAQNLFLSTFSHGGDKHTLCEQASSSAKNKIKNQNMRTHGRE